MRKLILLIISLLFCTQLYSQEPTEWPQILGFSPESQLTLTDQDGFYRVMGVATFSYILSELILKNEDDLNFYQARAGVKVGQYQTVFLENFGIEKRAASWFAFTVELNNQQWINNRPGAGDREKSGAGMGITTYYKWYLFGKKKLSPFLEYGAGVFTGFKEFPANGTTFTFNLSTQLGLEYSFSNENRLRLSYGQFHQSNNDLFSVNPGHDGNGLNITYAWYWGTSKW